MSSLGRIALSLFIFSSALFGAPPCIKLLPRLAPSFGSLSAAEKLARVEKALADEGMAKALLAEFLDEAVWGGEGVPVVTLDERGINNYGTYEMPGAAGTHFLKVLRIGVVDSNMPVFLSDLRGMCLGEIAGGPKVLGIGKTKFQVKATPRVVYYLELESLFAGETRTTFKQSKPEKLLENSVIEKMADAFVGTLEKDIVPTDHDFIFNGAGTVRWIDSAQWSTESDRPKLLDQYRNAVTTFIINLDSRRAAGAQAQRRFFERFLRGLKASPRFSADEKTFFLKNFIEKNYFNSEGLTRTFAGMGLPAAASPLTTLLDFYGTL